MIRVTKALQRAGCALLLGLAVATCRDDPTGPRQRASLALAPVLPAQALNLAAFGLTIDSLRVIIVRPPNDTVVNTVAAFAVDQDSVALQLELDLEAETETFDVTLQLSGGGFVLFSATTTVEVTAGQSGAGDPVEIANFAYTGPGAGITSLVVTPSDSVIRLSDSLRFRVDAFATDLPVTQFYVTWSTTNETLAPINAHGVLLAPNLRGGVQVIATTPNGIADTVPVTFIPVPVSIAPVGPIPVDVAPGSLIGPLRARVLASDGFGVKGIPVTFAAVSGGGAVNNALVVSDTGGYVETPATAGGGPVSVYTATVAGIASPATFNVSILTPPAGTQLAFTFPPAGAVVDIPFSVLVEVRDAQGIVVPGANDAVTIAFGANPGSATLGGTLTVNAVQGVAVFADLTINQPDSGYTLVVTAPGLAPDTTPPFSVIPGFTGRLWTNPAGGNWSDPANWSGGIVPAAGDSVYILLDGDYTVTLDVNASMGALILGASSGVQTLSGVGRTLQVDSILDVLPTGLLDLTSSTLLGPNGQFFNDGQLRLQASTVEPNVFNGPSAQMTVRGFVRLSGDFVNVTGGLLTIEADPNCCTATLEVEGNNFSNAGQIVLTAVNGTGTTAALQVSNAQAFNLPGAVISVLPGSGGARTLNLDLVNSGTVQVDADVTLSHTSADHDNSGLVQLGGGNLTITQAGLTPSFTSSGSIVVTAGRTLAVTGGAFNYASPAPGGLGGLGVVSFNGVTLGLDPDFVHDTLGLSLLNSTVNGPGTLTNAAGRTLTVQQTAINVPFVNLGTFVARGASALNGIVTADASGTIQIQADPNCCVATLTVANGFTNDGLIELTAVNGTGTTATLIVNAGTFVNATGGTIAALPGTGGARLIQAQMSNDGTLLVAHDLTLSKADADHLNSGSIQLTGGDLAIAQSGSNPTFTTPGTIVVAAGRTLAVTGGGFHYSNAAPGGLTGSGTLSFNSTVLGLGPALTNDTLSLTLLNSSVDGPGTLTNAAGATLTIQQTAINAPFINNGLLVARGASSLNGGIATSSTSTIQVQGDPNCCVATLTVPTGFTNSGVIELTAINGTGTTATLDLPSGFLVNGPGATIAARGGTGGARNLNVALNNQGTVLVETDMSLVAASADHVNSGLIHVTGGTLSVPQGGITPTFTTTGTILVAAGRTFDVGNGAFNYANVSPGGLAGLGSFTFLAAAVNLTPPLSNDSLSLSFTNSTVSGPGLLTNAAGRSLTIQQTAINAAFVNQGQLVTRGASSLGGPVTAAAGGTIRVQGDPNCCVATLSVATSLTNDGLIELTAFNGTGTTSTLDVAGGLTNGTGGTIAILPGTGGARVLNAQLLNHGQVHVATSATLTAPSGEHLNDGTVTVSAGTLSIPLGVVVPTFNNQGTVEVLNGATALVTGGATGTFANASNGTLSGAGTFDFSAATFVNDGTVAPGGSPGALTFTGAYAMSAGAVMSIEIGGTTPGTQYDQVVVSGTGTLTGTLNVTLINGFTPTIGQVFTIVSGAGILGLPVSLNLPSVAGAVWLPSLSAAGMQLSLLSASALLPVEWTNGLGGNWSTGSNWNIGSPPGPNDSAIINLPGTYAVVVDANVTTAFLDLGTAAGGGTKSLALSGPTLTLTSGGVVGGAGVVNLSSGTLTGGGTLQVAGDVNWTGGTISGAGFVLVSPTGAFTLSGTGTKNLNSRKIQTVGAVTWNGSGAIGSGGGAELRVQSGGTFAFDADASWLYNLGGAQPRVIVETGGTLSRSNGTGIAALFVPLDNAGSVQVNTGTLELRGGAATGSFALAAGTQLDFPSATYSLGNGAAISGAGRARIVGGTMSVDGAAPVPVNRLVLQTGSLLGAGAVEVQDSLLWSGGAMSGSGLTNVAAGADLVISGNVTLSGRTIVNDGVMTWTAGTISSGNGAAVQNSADALFEIQANASWLHNQGGTVPLISNSPGAILLRSTGTGLGDLRAAVNNAGTLHVASGTLGLNGGGTSGGAFTAAGGTELSFSGTHILPVGSSINAGGLVGFAGGTATVGGSFDVTGQTVIKGGSVAFDIPDTARTTILDLQGGTLGGSGVVLVRTAGTWSGGTLGGTGVLRIPAGVTLNVTGPVSFSERTLANAGQIVWSAGSINSGLAALLNNESGAVFDVRGTGSWVHNLGGTTPQVNNLVGATLRRSTSSGAATFNVPVANAGALDVQIGTLVLNSGAVNSGAHLVNSGATLQYGASTHSMTTGAAFGGLGRVLISGATMNIDAAAADTIEARWIQLTGGAIGGTGVLRVLDSLVWTAGTLADAGVLRIPVGGLLELRGAGAKTFNARTIANAGLVSWIGTGVLSSGNNATLLIENGGTFQLESDADWLYNQGGSTPHIDNLSGGLIKRGGASSAINVGAALNNDGTLDLQTGSVSFLGGGSSKGGFLLSAPGTLVFGGGNHVLDVGSAVSGNGGFHVSAATMTLIGDYNVTGTTRISGGTAVFDGSKPAEVTTLDLSAGILSGVGQVNLHGTGTWTGGTMTGTGQLRVLAGAALTLDGAGAKVFTQRTILNSAVVTWKGTGVISSGFGAVLTNQAGATFELQGDAAWQHAQGGAVPVLNNAGSVKRNLATGTVSIGAAVNNAGSVDVTTGTLSLTGGGASAGLFAVSPGAVLDFGGGTHTLSGGTSRVDGGGLVNFSAGNTTLSGTAANAYDVTGTTQILNPAVVNFNTTDSVRMSTLQLRGGTMNGTAHFAIRTNGTALWTGGGLGGPTGTVLRLPDKAVLNIGGAATKAFTGRTIAVEGGASANWVLGSINAIAGATLDVQSSAVFNVSSTGAWSYGGGTAPLIHIRDRADMNVTTAGTTTLAAGVVFNNEGTLTIAAGATLKVGADLNLLTGSTLQGDGVLDVVGNSKVVNQGSTKPGINGPGILTIAGSWPQPLGSAVVIDVWGPTLGTQYDQLKITGASTPLGASLQIVGNGSYQPNTITLNPITWSGLPVGVYTVTYFSILQARSVTNLITGLAVTW